MINCQAFYNLFILNIVQMETERKTDSIEAVREG